MSRKLFFLMAFFLMVNGCVNAMNAIDDFVRDHCGEACNGESEECTHCYNEAVDLFDQTFPGPSREIEFEF